MDVIEISRSGSALSSRWHPTLGGRGNHGFHVHVISVALADQPACRMGNDRHVTIVHRTDDALGLGLAGEVELVVDRGHNAIEPGQDLVRQNSRLPSARMSNSRSLEYGEAIELLIQLVDLIDLTRSLVDRSIDLNEVIVGAFADVPPSGRNDPRTS